MRQEFSAKVKVAAYQRSGGRCEACTAPLRPGHVHYDHVVPDALGGSPTIENCAVLCTSCHGAKTARQDVPQIAKMKRQKQAHIGARKPSRFPKKPPGTRFDWSQGRYVKETT